MISSRFTSSSAGKIFARKESLTISYGPSKLQDLHLYCLAASLQLSHLQRSNEPQLGQLNLTHLSLGIIGLWHELHTGKVIADDILKLNFYRIYILLINGVFSQVKSRLNSFPKID